MSESEIEDLRRQIRKLQDEIAAARSPFSDLSSLVRASVSNFGDQLVELRVESEKARSDLLAGQERMRDDLSRYQREFQGHLVESAHHIARIDQLERDGKTVTEKLTSIETAIKDVPGVIRAYAFVGRQWENALSNALKVGLIGLLGWMIHDAALVLTAIQHLHH